MTTLPSISWESLEQQVQACVTHLYDYTFLQGNPLVHLLASELTGPDRVDAFRNLIIEAIERLRPGPSVAFHSRAARAYNILSLRYIAQEQTSEVIKQLALSERQFYRDHSKAIRSLSAILWERLTGTVVPDVSTSEPTALSMQSEVRSLSEHSELERLDLRDLVIGAIRSTQPLAEARGVSLTLDSPNTLAEVEADRTLLRQLMLTILSLLVTGTERNTRIQVSIQGYTRRPQLVFTLTGPVGDPEALREALDNQAALQYLIKTLKARLRLHQSAPDEVRITLEIVTAIQTVLIVDDNPDAIDLFHRYLADQRYQILSANNGAHAIQLAREMQPDVIILDIMLPGQDGLEVLQNLKHHEVTQHIPVLVCSILDMQALALSLGADDYLKKPPGQQEILSRLEHWTA